MPNMCIVPLLDRVPSPEFTHTTPPVARVFFPDNVATGVPIPLVPLPALTNTLPPRPLTAALEPKHTNPLLPVIAEPELNIR